MEAVPSSTETCPACGASLRGTESFCPACGFALPALRRNRLFTQTETRLRSALGWSMAFHLTGWYCCLPAFLFGFCGLTIACLALLLPALLQGRLDAGAANLIWAAPLALLVPLVGFVVLARAGRFRCPACSERLILTLMDRRCFCYRCGMRILAGRRPPAAGRFPSAPAACGSCAEPLSDRGPFCPACGMNAAGALGDPSGAVPTSAADATCATCGTRVLGFFDRLLHRRVPLAFCPACGSAFAPAPRK